ncbi:MAG: hypothetical protein IT236_04085, partial [Bacteroidia bacterium]|nr:hypothetical protein [Bacteroidia bacterium]
MKFKLILVLLCGLCLFTSCSDGGSSDATDIGAQQQKSKLDQAGAQFQQGNYFKAIEILDEIIKVNDPTTIYQATYNKAYCYYKLDDYNSMNKFLEFVLDIDKDNANYNWFRYNAFFMLGRAASKEEKPEKAIEYFMKALEYKQTHDIYNTMAFVETELGRYEPALEHINLAIGFDNTSTNAYSTRALVNLKLNKINEAIADVEKAIQIDSLNPYAYKH